MALLLKCDNVGVAENRTFTQFCAVNAKMFEPMTTVIRDALVAGEYYPGLVIYNTTTGKLNVRVAAAWEAVTSA